MAKTEVRIVTDTAILDIEGLEKSFGGIVAVDSLDLRINGSKITGIIGPNGAGKSTLINLVSGHLMPTKGVIRFNNKDITDVPEHKRAKQGIAKSFQVPQLYNQLTTIENVYASLLTRDGRNSSLFSSIAADDELESEAVELLKQFGIEEYRDMEAESLPHGVRKILDIAMSVALDPEIIMLDEPTSGVGSEKRGKLMETVVSATRQSDAAIVFVEHDMELVAEFSDRVIALHNGRLLSDGDPDEVLESEEVKQHIREEGA